jgi:GR25 family glycosyltransferase involved in LPS biosynthesis
MDNLMIAIINLDKDEERLKYAKDQLSNLGLQYSRVAAVVGEEIDPALYFVSNPNVAGCWLSHVSCYKQFIDSKCTHLLVLEDDFVIYKPAKFLKVVEIALKSKENIIQLGFLSYGFMPKIEQANHIVNKFLLYLFTFFSFGKSSLRLINKVSNRASRYTSAGVRFIPSDFLAGTHCYLVDKDAASLLIKTNQPVVLPTDGHLQALCRSGTIRSKRSIVSHVGQRPGFSSIEMKFTSRK